MTEVVDGRNDQLLEDAFSDLSVEDLQGDSGDEILEELLKEAGEEEESSEEPAPAEGTDKVLARLAETDPAAHRLTLSMQQDMSRMRNQFNELKAQMLDVVQELKGKGGESEEASETPPEPALPEGVSPEHLQIFQQMAAHLGYVKTSELQEKETTAARESHAETALKQAVELFGDEFGSLDEEGKVSVSEGAREAMSEVEKRITDPSRGLTALELFLLAKNAARAGRQAKNGQPTARRAARPVTTSNVARRSTGGSGKAIKFYDPSRGDTRENAFDRAWILSKKELGF